MALKAGRVGVNPSQVDMAGNVIGGGGDTYTKLEIDQLLGSKVGIGQLEANNKDFYFAYDETSQKYGYKLDGTGDFHPFEEAGGSPGWNKPADLITTGLTFYRCEYKSGGYAIIDGLVYFDIIVTRTSTSQALIENAPMIVSSYSGLAVLSLYNTAYNFEEDYVANNLAGISISETNCRINISTGTSGSDTHVWGVYPLAS